MKGFYRYLTVALCAAMLTFTSCKSRKASVAAPAYEPETSAAAKPAKTAPVRNSGGEVARLAGTYAEWTDVSMPVKVEMKKPKKINLSGKASMVRGKSINVSMRMFGIEMASLNANADSIYIVAKVVSSYYAESMEKFRSVFGLGLEDIQSLLLGQACTPGSGTLSAADAGDFNFSPIEGLEAGEGMYYWSMVPKKAPKGVEWTYMGTAPVDASSAIVPVLIGLAVEPTSTSSIVCAFEEQGVTPAGMTAGSVNASGSIGKNSVEATFRWTLDQSQWNKGISPTTVKIPRNYRRLSTSQVVNMLKKL